MSTTDPFDGGASSLADFGANFSALGWATSETPKGEDTSSGWKSVGTSSKSSGVYYAPTVNDVGWGLAGVATVAELPSEKASMSIWIDMPTPGSTKAGYELKAVHLPGGSAFWLTLSKWVGGTQTELASEPSYTLAKGTELALTDVGSTVAVYSGTGSGFFQEFSQLLSATDSTYEGGKIGIAGSGSTLRLTEFRAAALRAPMTTTEAATSVLNTSATLNGTVNPNSYEETNYWFEYGTTTAYGETTKAEWVPAFDPLETAPVSQALTGLASSTTYHYRLVAESEAGRTYGIDKTFTTKAP